MKTSVIMMSMRKTWRGWDWQYEYPYMVVEWPWGHLIGCPMINYQRMGCGGSNTNITCLNQLGSRLIYCYWKLIKGEGCLF